MEKITIQEMINKLLERAAANKKGVLYTFYDDEFQVFNDILDNLFYNAQEEVKSLREMLRNVEQDYAELKKKNDRLASRVIELGGSIDG